MESRELRFYWICMFSKKPYILRSFHLTCLGHESFQISFFFYPLSFYSYSSFSFWNLHQFCLSFQLTFTPEFQYFIPPKGYLNFIILTKYFNFNKYFQINFFIYYLHLLPKHSTVLMNKKIRFDLRYLLFILSYTPIR